MEEPSSSMEGPSSGPAPASISRVSSEDADFFDTHHQEDDDGDGEGGPGAYTASDIADRFVRVIDSAAPVDPVRGAVSKFGGILDWRERRQQAEEELVVIVYMTIDPSIIIKEKGWEGGHTLEPGATPLLQYLSSSA
ncbi:hypothetical protein TRIUR3_03535 [Triticum urartu]|uniref:Uncharacterized protein n=1 Tax=Triticum urartu TaxID=4572 RepID=M7YR76_TRIUA|nr:hypothetical protein TRIUR3_03535 [Triticum urartu]